MTLFELANLTWGIILGVAIMGSTIGYRKRNFRQRDIPAGNHFRRR